MLGIDDEVHFEQWTPRKEQSRISSLPGFRKPGNMTSFQIVLFDFLVEGFAIDAEEGRSLTAMPFGMVQRHQQVTSFHRFDLIRQVELGAGLDIW